MPKYFTNAGKKRIRRVSLATLDKLPVRLKNIVQDSGVWIEQEYLDELTKDHGEENAYVKISETVRRTKSRIAYEEYGPDHPDAKFWNKERKDLKDKLRLRRDEVMLNIGINIERGDAERRRPKGMTQVEFEDLWDKNLENIKEKYRAKITALGQERRKK